jgi:hypothetical protein
VSSESKVSQTVEGDAIGIRFQKTSLKGKDSKELVEIGWLYNETWDLTKHPPKKTWCNLTSSIYRHASLAWSVPGLETQHNMKAAIYLHKHSYSCIYIQNSCIPI